MRTQDYSFESLLNNHTPPAILYGPARVMVKLFAQNIRVKSHEIGSVDWEDYGNIPNKIWGYIDLRSPGEYWDQLRR
jgi:hypothetical protein